ncbi:MAG: hypothetical protein ACO239_06640 [Sediminibacterium sp.]|jgi:hypothetical protein
MKNLNHLQLITKVVSRNPLFEKQLCQFSISNWDLIIYADFERTLMRDFAKSSKWKTEIDDSGFIYCTRKAFGLTIKIILW